MVLEAIHTMRKEIDSFLRENGMHFDTIEIQKEIKAFCRQMEDGLEGRKSSLQMIPTYITMMEALPFEKEVIVMDAGGTNFRVALVRREKSGEMTISHFSKRPMPGTKGRLDKTAFFSEIADHLETVLKKSEALTVGFCFSFATEMLPSKEGRIVEFSKELQVDGAIGELVGENLNRILEARGYAHRKFILLNDTVATMLGGMAKSESDKYDSYVGYILGTGSNTCYFESCENIKKSSAAMKMPGKMAINCESGSYAGFAQGVFDRALDCESKNPGSYQMEKMVSGAYQGNLIYKTVKGAAEQGLFSSSFSEKLAAFTQFTMPQIDGFCADRKNGGELAALASSEKDNEMLYDIIDASFERSARLTLIIFASILLQSGAGKDKRKPACITGEGTSFTKSVLFRPKLNRYIENILNGEMNLYCDIISVEDATLTGSAVAALMDL